MVQTGLDVLLQGMLVFIILGTLFIAIYSIQNKHAFSHHQEEIRQKQISDIILDRMDENDNYDEEKRLLTITNKIRRREITWFVMKLVLLIALITHIIWAISFVVMFFDFT